MYILSSYHLKENECAVGHPFNLNSMKENLCFFFVFLLPAKSRVMSFYPEEFSQDTPKRFVLAINLLETSKTK